jgi:hypothetical protein
MLSKFYTLFFIAIGLCGLLNAQEIHVWDTYELSFNAEKTYINPYIEVETWVLLTGPSGSGFEKKRIWGFWDGGNVFKVRVTATVPGTWTWESGSNQSDKGLNENSGSYTARGWTEAEKKQNPNRRGTIRPTSNNRAFMYADGTPFFLLSDTHWGAASWRLPWAGKEPPADYLIDKNNYSFEVAIQNLKKIGFNSLSLIFSHPGWNIEDGRTPKVEDCKGYVIRQAKEKTGTSKSKVRGMHDEYGNMPFFFAIKSGCTEDIMPDYDRINPAYWKSLDKKFQYMQDNGFVCYAEGARRDHSQAWKEYFNWPGSYAKYLNYLQARYGTYNMIFSLMHGDNNKFSISFEDWNLTFDYWHIYYGDLPFGQVQTLMAESTLRDFGHVTEHPWMQAHTVGNSPKHHGLEENLMKIWNKEPHIPGFCNEPYYVNFNKPWNSVGGEIPSPNSARDNYLARAHIYGLVLSGSLPGLLIGTGSRWDNSKEEPDDPDYPGGWETMHYPIMKQAVYMKKWILSSGTAYRNLELAKDDLSSPMASGSLLESLDGWSHMMHTSDKKVAFLYFENKAVGKQTVSGLIANKDYRVQWWDPRTGKWIDMTSNGHIKTDSSGSLTLPNFPDTISENNDWAARLMVKPESIIFQEVTEQY